MRRLEVIAVAVVLVAGLVAASGAFVANRKQDVREADPREQAAAGVVTAYGRLAARFEPNVGQTDPAVKYLSRGPGATLFFTEDAPVFLLRRLAKGERASSPREPPRLLAAAAVRMKFLGASSSAQLEGLDELPGRNNYFMGSDPAKWRTGVPAYARVVYRGIYAGVDIVFHGDERQMEYDLALEPGADPSAIRVAFDGAEGLAIVGDGSLLIHTVAGDLVQRAPSIFQMPGGGRRAIEGHYRLHADRSVGIEVGAHDRSLALLIDPVLAYSTYLGAAAAATGIAVDGGGNAYVAGYTASAAFPTTAGAIKTTFTGADSLYGYANAYVSKLNPAGSALLYSTFLGGTNGDDATGIAVDSAGNAYVVGATNSTDFPVTSGAFQTTFGGSGYTGCCQPGDAWVAKLNSTGSALLYSTYLGGSGWDIGEGIAIDSLGDAYVVGQTHSTNYPITAGTFQTTYRGSYGCGGNTNSGFVTALNPSGTALVYSTYLGGGGFDLAFGVAVDASRNAYVTGYTCSTDFPVTAGAFQTSTSAGSHAFLTKLSPAGGGVYSTYLHGSSFEQGNAVAVDASGNAYVVGQTSSSDFPTTAGAFQTTIGGGADGFLTKMNASGSGLVYSTFLGGSASDLVRGIALDSSGRACLAGSTASSDFPTANAVQGSLAGSTNAVVATVNADGSRLVFSSYLGGGATDYANAIALDADGNTFVSGVATSANFPTTAGSFQPAYAAGSSDAFIAKLIAPLATQTLLTSSANPSTGGQAVTFAAAVTTPAPPTAGMMGHWRLDEAGGATGAADSSGNGNNALCGGPVDVGLGSVRASDCPLFGTAGPAGSAAGFDGTDDFLYVQNTIPDSFTVAAWVNTTDNGPGFTHLGDPAYFGDGIVWSDVSGYILDMIPMSVVAGHLAFGTNGCSGGSYTFTYDTLTSTVPINTGQWIHLAVTRNTATGAKQIYLNGVLDNSNFAGNNCALDANAIIAFGANPLDYRFFGGKIADVYFYDHPLSSSEIRSLANLGPPSSGSVQFRVDGSNLGAPVPVVSGQASTSTSSLAGGTHAVTASYSGSTSANLAGSTSNTVQQVVATVPAPVITSPVSPYSSTSPTLTVSGTALAAAPISLFDGANLVSTATADSSGHFTANISFTYGTHSLTATQTVSGVTSAASNAVSILITAVPAVTAPADQSANEGATVSYELGSFSDASGDGPWTVTVDWGDGSTNTVFSASTAGIIAAHSHRYLDNRAGDAPYTVTVQVTSAGPAGQIGQATFAVTVHNVAPAVNAPGGQSATEGVAQTFNFGSFSDPGVNDFSWSASVDWGDGSTADGWLTSATGVLSNALVRHAYAKAGVFTANVTVTDKDGASGGAQFAITVDNVAPAVTAPANGSASEGTAAAIALGSFADVSGDGPWSVAIDWGDGSAGDAFQASSPGSLGSRSHAWADNGSYLVTVTVTDSPGLSSHASFQVAVANVAPTATLSNGGPIDEGGSATIGFSGVFDPSSVDSDAGFHYAFACAGSLAGSSYATSGTSPSTSCIFSDPGAFNVAGRIFDKDGGFTEYTTTVVVNDVAPTVFAPANQLASEGSMDSIGLGSFSDPGVDDGPWTVSVAWGDGTTAAFTAVAPGSLGTLAHAYADNGHYVATVAVADRQGLSGGGAFAVDVANVAPSLAPAGDQSADEGVSTAWGLGSFSDPGANDAPWSVSVDWGDGSAPASFSVAAQGSLGAQGHTYLNHGAYTATVTVTDKDGGAGQAAFSVTVANVPPAVAGAGSQGSDEGAVTAFSLGSFADNLEDGPWTVAVDWGDGSASTTFTALLPGSLGASHAYADNGAYAVAVTVYDRFGAQGSEGFSVSVANVPPSASIAGAPDSVAEGTDVHLASAVSDPGPADTAAGFAYSWIVTKNGSLFQSGSAAGFSFTPDDDGTYVVSLAVTDKDGGSGSDSRTITVTNVAPTATISLPQAAVYEGSSFVIALTAPFDPSAVDTAAGLAYAFDCGDGTGFADTGAQPSRSCATTDEGTRHVGLQIRDKDGGATSYFADVAVNGVPPSAQFNIAGSTTVVEGSAITFALISQFDPSSADTASGFHYSFACDASGALAGDYASASPVDNVTCTFDDGPSVHIVTGRIFDADSLYTDYQVTVEVQNVPPSPSIAGAPSTSPEGSAITLAAGATDPSAADAADGFAFAWSVTKGGATFASGDGATFTFTPDDNASYLVTLTATDKDGGTGTATAAIAVTNVAPSATFAVTPGSVNEGATYTLSLTGAADPSSADTAAGFGYSFDCGDGALLASAGNSRTCTANGSGTYTVRGRITDKDGGMHDYAGSVVVNDVAPTAGFGGPPSVAEGSAAVFSFTNASDPSSADVSAGFHYSFDCAGGSLADATYASSGTAASATCTFDDGPATRTVSGRIFDAGGASTLYTATIQVLNVAPAATLVTSGPGSPCKAGDGDGQRCDPVVISLINPVDPSVADTVWGFRYAFSCDGTSLSGATWAGSGSANSAACQFAAAGVYTVLARIIDKDGGYTQYQAQVEVGGRETGGGTLAGGVSHGFELHCDHSQLPNRLEINWGRGQKFTMETMTAGGCIFDPSVAPPRPEAQFNTLTGAGAGRLNGVPGYGVTFAFTDADAGGLRDIARMTIVSPSGATVFSAWGTLTGGHQEAHRN